MKVIKSIFLFFLFVLIFFTSIFYSIKDQRITSIDNYEILDIKSDKLFLSCDLKIYNPNWFNITTDDVIFKLYLDSIYLGSGNLNKKVNLLKKDTAIISADLDINKNILNSFVNLKDSISINILGSSSIPLISKRYFFSYSKKINFFESLSLFSNKLIKNIDLDIYKINIRKFDFKNIYLDLFFRLNNKSKFECSINKLDIEVYKNNNYSNILAQSKINAPFVINPDTFNDFKSSIKLNAIKMASAVFSNTNKSKSSLYIKANSIIDFNKITFPLIIHKKIEFNPLTLEIY